MLVRTQTYQTITEDKLKAMLTLVHHSYKYSIFLLLVSLILSFVAVLILLNYFKPLQLIQQK